MLNIPPNFLDIFIMCSSETNKNVHFRISSFHCLELESNTDKKGSKKFKSIYFFQSSLIFSKNLLKKKMHLNIKNNVCSLDGTILGNAHDTNY